MTLPAVTKTLTVPLPPERAFDLFTRRMGEWWPLHSHSLSASGPGPARGVTVADHVGRDVAEVMADGTTALWGRVTEWAPGAAFAMTWQLGRPAEQATRLRVTFAAVAGGTRVDLVHDGWDALPEAAEASRGQYEGGWDLVFTKCYGEAATRMANA